MNNNQAVFLLKVLVLSVAISIFIKDAAPAFPVPETTTNALIAVLLPSIVMGLLLLLRMKDREEKKL